MVNLTRIWFSFGHNTCVSLRGHEVSNREVKLTSNQNLYEILGIDNLASQQVIEHVYKNLQKAYHPDMHPENSEFYTQKIKLINKAFEVLGNPQARIEYDKSLARNQMSNTENNTGLDNDEEENQNRDEESFLHCRKCGKRIEGFLITCPVCGELDKSSNFWRKEEF